MCIGYKLAFVSRCIISSISASVKNILFIIIHSCYTFRKRLIHFWNRFSSTFSQHHWFYSTYTEYDASQHYWDRGIRSQRALNLWFAVSLNQRNKSELSVPYWIVLHNFSSIALNCIVLNRIEIGSHCIVIGVWVNHIAGSCFACIFNVSYHRLCI